MRKIVPWPASKNGWRTTTEVTFRQRVVPQAPEEVPAHAYVEVQKENFAHGTGGKGTAAQKAAAGAR